MKKPVNKKILTFLGYLFPVIPINDAVKNKNKGFFLFIEQPALGIFTTFTSLLIAQYVSGIVFKFDIVFLRNFGEIYFSYQIANIIRNGVNINDGLSKSRKILLNWFYSVITYIFFTAGDRLAFADTRSELAFACGLITFAVIWPVLSQTLSTCLWTPVMFSKFPRLSLLKKINDKSLTVDTITEEIMPEESSHRKWALRWLIWFRGEDDKRRYRLSLRYVQYWLIKTFYAILVALFMTTIYYLVRWNIVGFSAESGKLFTDIWYKILQ